MRILLIGNDSYINCLAADISKDYVVDMANDSTDGSYLSEVNDYDAVVVNETDYCSQINSVSPIFMLADKCSYIESLEAIKKGVDVCIPKSTSTIEVKDILKHVVFRKHACSQNILSLRNLVYYPNSKYFKVDDKIIDLRRKEYDILEYLLINKNKIVSKEELLEHIWVNGLYLFSNSVEVHIKHIRDKIEKPFGYTFIKTVRGYGYQLT